MGDYLNIDSVLCVGGSWLASAPLMAAGDWAGITDLAVRSVQKAAELNIESDPSL
jgi:2-dehydro-3-deoxyphosphogluconate aldolase/(4S)-4-hydroxy-2-oxoglutarate aldolase